MAKLPLHSLPYHRESRRFSSHRRPSPPSWETFFPYSSPSKEGCEGEVGMAVGTSPITSPCAKGLRPLGFAPRAARGPPSPQPPCGKKRAGEVVLALPPLLPSRHLRPLPLTYTRAPRFAATPNRLSPHPPPGGAGAASLGAA